MSPPLEKLLTPEQVGERLTARNAVRKALRDGTLIRQPCCVCGAMPAQGHHDDYRKPLAVIWLCQRHHSLRHGGFDYAQGRTGG